ncbi:hypothetical protein H6G36_26275 [Anabaena minutissima FACHB-250]|nr:hypothetical protein [Anabaena minutissima FACHB-250]
MEIVSQTSLKEKLSLITELEIGKQMDNIIPRIKDIAIKFSIAQKDKKSPFRNVLAVATESSSSVEIIKNYIRYQVGRSGSSPIWKTSKDSKLFATAVVEYIDNLYHDAQKIVEILRRFVRDGDLHSYLETFENQEQLKKNIHLKLTQLFLGYLAREHTAIVGEEKAKAANNTQNEPKHQAIRK